MADEDKLRAFRDELALLQLIRHPNVVQFLGAVTQSSPMMIVTEYLRKEYNVRASASTDKTFYIGRYVSGFPPFSKNSAENRWSVHKEGLQGRQLTDTLRLGAAPISSHEPVLFVDQLVDQVAKVLNFFGLGSVMCFGVTTGAYILTLFATKYRDHVMGLILVSPLCKTPSWSEWLCSKVVSNLHYFYGMCGLVTDYFLQRYFSKEVRGNSQVPESDIVQACRSLLDEKQSSNVWWFLQSNNGRYVG